ncbi:hypothetical protein CYMTET_18930 [Cymbomonas tetramitiformis]|uniref:Uncharacterized protein n=1 Tax=Cymbomonas tetramitiformis TaxID=36881 RepID=A0AAE0G7L9_9CHLO|nr:hypothetical protein CYMTET_18930 [Cymbomonas tetramitiformis]
MNAKENPSKRQRQSQADDSEISAQGAASLQRSINLDCDGAAIRSLIAKGVIDAQDKTGHTPLFWAVQTGGLDLARELLEGGASMEAAADTNNWTCLHQAALMGEANMVDLLLLHGAQAIAHDSSDGRTPMHIALAHSPHPDQGVVFKLASAGAANMVMHDKDRCAPLHVAAAQGARGNSGDPPRAGADIEARAY